MAHAWFIHSGEVVNGPFTTDEVNTMVMNNRIPLTSQVWWKGQREWMPLSQWQERVKDILDSVAQQTKNAIWFVEHAGETAGPLTQSELVLKLKGISDLAAVRVWATGSEKKMNPFEMHDLMELIGINRREYERTPVTGTVVATHAQKNLMEYKLKAFSISKGGLGVVGKHEFRRGDKVNLMFDCPELGGRYHAHAEVVYITEQGYTGIRFLKANAETLLTIEDYVKKFTVPEPSDKLAPKKDAA